MRTTWRKIISCDSQQHESGLHAGRVPHLESQKYKNPPPSDQIGTGLAGAAQPPRAAGPAEPVSACGASGSCREGCELTGQVTFVDLMIVSCLRTVRLVDMCSQCLLLPTIDLFVDLDTLLRMPQHVLLGRSSENACPQSIARCTVSSC
jgi:hypothetical protein